MITRARLRYLGVPSLKVRRFASTIKGEPVDRAQAILDLQSSPTCQLLSKLLKSAVSNAENNIGLAPENLFVSNAYVDQGPTVKRIRPRARGRAYRILKRSCHVTIEVDLKKGVSVEEARKEQPRAAKKRPAAGAARKEKAPAGKPQGATVKQARPGKEKK